jgi:solute:Na+ symporter, SSS family
MRPVDWAVLLGTLALIVGWGTWKERGVKTAEMYLRGGHTLRWWTIGLSIMATQASAITFLSVPGQAYEDGMSYVQFYLGLPVAMVILSAVVLPIYYRLKVYTAYEYLETRFDRKTRQLTAFLFLLSRGLAAGISIYAPAIVLKTVLGWPLEITNLVIGGVVILYTVSGGTRVVARTQTYQMVVMLGGMVAAALFVWSRLPAGLSFDHAAHVAGALGRVNPIDFSTKLSNRYTFWSGMTGGLFVALAYFGTDQSQVQRYLGGESLTESRLGLLFNGLAKVPMQFLILGVGILLLIFYQFNRPPVFFDEAQWASIEQGPHAAEARAIDAAWDQAFQLKRARVDGLIGALAQGSRDEVAHSKEELRAAAADLDALRARAKELIHAEHPKEELKDSDYIFIGFVVSRFPPGLVGLLLAVVLCASMSAVAAALSSLGSTSVVDFYRPSIRPDASDHHYLMAAKIFTAVWGVLAVLFAAFASQIDNLIQAVNILGSLFYGPMLGVFLVGFFFRRVGATPVFVATLIAEATVVGVFAFTSIGFLWYNVIGCAEVIGISLSLSLASSAVASPSTRR